MTCPGASATCARASTTKTQSLSALRVAAAASAVAGVVRLLARQVAGLAAVLIHDGLHEVVEEVRAAARAGAMAAAPGASEGPLGLELVVEVVADIPVATVVKTAWRHCQARYDRMAAAGASSSPTTTAWTRASHGDLSSIAQWGPGLLLEAPAWSREGRVDGAPEGRDVGAPVAPERLPAPVPPTPHLRAGGHARVGQIQRPREALVVGPGLDRYHRSPGRAVDDVSQRRAGAHDDARRREECARCFTGSEASQRLTTRASVNAASVPASKIRVTVRSMAVVPRTQARSWSSSARDFVESVKASSSAPGAVLCCCQCAQEGEPARHGLPLLQHEVQLQAPRGSAACKRKLSRDVASACNAAVYDQSRATGVFDRLNLASPSSHEHAAPRTSSWLLRKRMKSDRPARAGRRER